MTAKCGLVLALLLGASPTWTPAAAEAAPVQALAPPPGDAPRAALAFAPGEELVFQVDYLGIRTGSAKIRLGKPEGAIWPIICQGQTDGVASLLDIREHFVSYWDSEAQVSLGNDLNAIEVGDRHTDRARFDRESGVATVQVIRRGEVRERTHEVPRDVNDLPSALLALRAQPLAPGARVEMPVFSSGHVFTLRAEVVGIERVDTPAGRFDALKVRLHLGFKDKFKTGRDSYIWLSNDVRHVPVKARADFAVGSVTAMLVNYRRGGQLAAR